MDAHAAGWMSELKTVLVESQFACQPLIHLFFCPWRPPQGFVTSIGNRNRRVMMATEHTFAPVVHGATSTFLGIIMLVSTEFDFIIK